ncbi:MAG: hypothetical protein QXP36_11915 [Conexivisphaerales archaeon]
MTKIIDNEKLANFLARELYPRRSIGDTLTDGHQQLTIPNLLTPKLITNAKHLFERETFGYYVEIKQEGGRNLDQIISNSLNVDFSLEAIYRGGR